MLAYRLVRAPYLATPLDGEGARLYGSRWTRPGWRVVYLADHPGTAIVETLVHLATPALAPPDYHLVTVEVPDDLVAAALEIDAATLPTNWRDVNSEACLDAGAAWLTATSHPAVCRAPSAVVPDSRNLLLDVTHAAAVAAHVVAQHTFSFDPRLLP